MKRKAGKRGKIREALAGYGMIAPLFSGLLVFYVYSFFLNFYDSFTNKSSFGKPRLVGLKNYLDLFRDAEFYQALENTLLYVVICVPFVVVLALILAALLNLKIRGRGLYRTLIFLPAVTLPAAIGLLWKWLLNYEYGLVNEGVRAMGGAPVAWLSDPKYVLISVSAVFIWGNVAYQMIILLAGLQGISRSYFEAAEMDGATFLQRFFRVVIPLLSPTIFFVTVTTMINVFQIFDFIYMMIPKGSSGTAASSSLVTYFFEVSFEKFHKGYGAAAAMVLFLLIFAITAVQLLLQKKWVYYDE